MKNPLILDLTKSAAAVFALISLTVFASGKTLADDDHDEGKKLSLAEAIHFSTGAYTGGSSTLTRSEDGIDMTFSTQGLEPGATYTAWWIIFNRPSNCSGGMCGPDDLSSNREATKASMLWASGSIVGQDGIGNFSASLGKERPEGEVIFGPALQNPRQAEVHIVLRSHGLPIPGMTHKQLGTLKGGCDINTCSNDQMVMHVNQ